METRVEDCSGYRRNPPAPPEAVKKCGSVFFPSFRRKPASSIFEALRTDWTPVPAPDSDPGFTGVTTKRQFFHSFPFSKGDLKPIA